jgi:hypothetical protein
MATLCIHVYICVCLYMCLFRFLLIGELQMAVLFDNHDSAFNSMALFGLLGPNSGPVVLS